MPNNFIILNAGCGKRTKTYGPKCLFKLTCGVTILEYQIQQINKYFPKAIINISVGFQHNKIIKHLNTFQTKYSNEIYCHFNPEWLTTTNSYSLYLVLKSINKSAIIIHGDLIFKGIDISFIEDTAIYCCDREDLMEIGPVEKTELKNLSWQSLQQYAQIFNLSKKDIPKFSELLLTNKKHFLFENFQTFVDNGNTIKINKINNMTFDVDLISDIKTADKYIEYSDRS